MTGDPLRSLTVADVLREHRHTRTHKTAVVCETTRLTYEALDERVNRLAGALRSAGVAEGERVLWLGQNCHRVLETLLAAAKIGAVLCPANWRQSPEELSFVISDCEPRVVVWQERDIGDAVRAARSLAGSKALWLRHDAEGPGTYEAFLASGPAVDPSLPVGPALPLLMIYTAAFEGSPNGALLPHRGILAQDIVLAEVQQIGDDDVYLACGPLFHIWTFINATATFQAGGTLVFTPRAGATDVARLIDAEGCTRAFILPPTINEIVELNRDGRYNLKSLRALPGPPEWNAMVQVDDTPWGRRPGGYGQTEVTGMLTYTAAGSDDAGAHGRPSSVVEVRIVNDDDVEVGAGEVGEIVARGPTVMTGYHRRPELNALRQRNGWHHTNDLGRQEADGSITFIGPKTAMIKSAAENIYPAEVEACIARHPAVKEVCVIGVPDPVWAQSVKAVVVLAPGQTATAEEIIAHCRASIASYKKPRIVSFADSLPRTPAGIIDRAAVDAAHGGGGYPGQAT